jgi:hypothetical protein
VKTEKLYGHDGQPLWLEHPRYGHNVDVVALELTDLNGVEIYPYDPWKVGTVAFSGLGLLMAGTMRAEAALPAANLIFILLLGAGGVVVPVDRFPSAAQGGLGLLPISALTHGLREVHQHGNSLPLGDVGILAAWAVIGVAAAASLFRWE